LKYLPGRGAVGALLLALAIPAALLAVASLPWHAERPSAPPHVTRAGEGAGSLRAGAAMVPFDLPPDVPIAGFARLSYRSEGADAVGARALVVEVPGLKLALVSAELLLVPEPLEAAVAARVADLGLGGLVVAATHTHAGPGGFWRHAVGERIATGPYDPRVEEALASGIAEAIRRADAALAPSRVSVARGEAADLARSRSGGAEDGRLTAMRVERPDGAPVAEVVVFAAHPTILGKENRRISGDWPGRLMASGARGVRLFFQGPIGDQKVEGPTERPETFARALAERLDALPARDPEGAPALAYAAVALSLPPPSPGAAPALLRRAARNLAHGAFPETAEVEAVRIGDALLVSTPAEPVAAVAAAWRAVLPPEVALVSLSGGYVGYVEAPERMETGDGETVRTQFGPDLAVRLGEAAALAAERVTPRAAAATAAGR
jgi:neutral ceramidase